mmetsp:Transcript_18216/g.42491  ORF Transcript_18216/g.42491 Transcript_18216/m.42491 type:complete len:88 (+) Transcript_18216:1264-1527(+)
MNIRSSFSRKVGSSAMSMSATFRGLEELEELPDKNFCRLIGWVTIAMTKYKGVAGCDERKKSTRREINETGRVSRLQSQFEIHLSTT